ncbi:MAG: Omp28-related outer membrane protein [Bacteroidales bacterium]|nr:Omp28-related outer membrane protein [Bacteroidales bacterium]
MKKFTFALMALLAFTFSLKAQQYVSTDPANRNVIIEEFTGRNCGYCPIGHRITHELMEAHPGRVWAINVHCTSLSPTSSPNLNVNEGHSIANGFNFDGIPMGMINRHSGTAAETSQFTSLTNNQLNQAAECNVGGIVAVNPETRVATITVEVYYTGNSSQPTNYLTIAMVQDSIIGSQSDYGDYNPGGWVSPGQYSHMHVLRDIVTNNIWGDEVTPTTQGSLVVLNYTYEIPETIGSPNGVEVDLDNIHFLAFVTQQYQGTPTRPILNGCQLDMVQGVDEPIYPIINGINQVGGSTCTHTKDIEVSIQNIGIETLTSMTLEVEFEGNTQTINWEGELPQYGSEKIRTTLEVPFGTYPVHVTLTEANGEPLEKEANSSISCIEWANLETENEEEELTLELMQDKFGNHITWEFTASDGTVLGSGGPYSMLASGTGTQLHIEHVTVPADECVKFTIRDQNGNGICCSFGQGYYIVKDSEGNVLFGDENDGQFGESASHLISVGGAQVQVEISETEVANVDSNHADFAAHLTYDGYPDEVGFSCRKVTSSEPMIIEGTLNEFRNILGYTDDLEQSSIYVVRAFAVINGETYYGSETTFQTMPDGVAELEQSLKIYPNPTTGVLNIQGEGMTSIEVYNAVGQRVMTQVVNGNDIQLNTESLNNGIYFLRIHANDGNVLNSTFSVAR